MMITPRSLFPRLLPVGLACVLAGCGDLAQHRLRPPEDGPLQPAPPLQIADPPRAIMPTSFADVRHTVPMPPPEPIRATVDANARLQGLYLKAVDQNQKMGAYTMRIRRREVVGDRARPEELILVKMRQEPWSVYFKWLGPEAKGREVVYVKGRPGNEIHTLTAAGDVILFGAGKRFSISADSPLVKSKSRYPITNAGLATTIRSFGAILEAVAKRDPHLGTVKYLGPVTRPEFSAPVEGVEQAIPPNSDPLLPGGGRRWWYFDTTLGLPVLIITRDAADREVEYYCHDQIQFPVQLTDDDFDPDRLWPQKAAKQ
jgi:hypothetical protein